MSSVNKVILVGRLGRDPEIRYTTNGTAVANFTLATNEVYTNKSGDKEERTEWHRIVAWSRLAEICGEYLSKGKMVYIEGSLRTRSWEDREGRKRYTTEVIAQNMQILSPAGEPTPASEPSVEAASKELEDFDIEDESFDTEDIPF